MHVPGLTLYYNGIGIDTCIIPPVIINMTLYVYNVMYTYGTAVSTCKLTTTGPQAYSVQEFK